eukprot:11954461-Alexandrium_andersonii.AAC.1
MPANTLPVESEPFAMHWRFSGVCAFGLSALPSVHGNPPMATCTVGTGESAPLITSKARSRPNSVTSRNN